MLIKGVWILRLFKIEGIVLYPFILVAPRHPHKALLNHERIHWDQIKKHGWWRFYTSYLKEYLQGRKQGLSHDEAYRKISFEQQAYRHQDDQSFIV